MLSATSRLVVPTWFSMTQYAPQWRSTRPNKTKAELREMLAEAVRNTAQPEPKPPTKAKRDRPKRAA
jgi:hypothetical protein